MLKNKYKFVYPIAAVMLLLSPNLLLAQGRVDVYECINDRTFADLMKSINGAIKESIPDKKQQDVDELISAMTAFGKNSEDLVHFLKDRKMADMFSSLEKHKNDDTQYLRNVLDNYARVYLIEPEIAADHNQEVAAEKLVFDMEIATVAGLSIIGQKALQQKIDKRPFSSTELQKEVDEYLNRTFLDADSSYREKFNKQYPENFAGENKELINKMIIETRKRIIEGVEDNLAYIDNNNRNAYDLNKYKEYKINEENLKKYFLNSSTNTIDHKMPDGQKLDCLTALEVNGETLEPDSTAISLCSAKYESDMNFFNSIYKFRDSHPNKVKTIGNGLYENPSSTKIKSLSSIRPREYSTKPILKPENLQSTLDTFNNKFVNNFKAKMQTLNSQATSLDVDITKATGNNKGKAEPLFDEAAFNEYLSSENNCADVAVLGTASDTGIIRNNETHEIRNNKAKKCLGILAKVFKRNQDNFSLISYTDKYGTSLNNLNPELKSRITNAFNELPKEELLHYLNLLNYVKNRYLSPTNKNSKGENCRLADDQIVSTCHTLSSKNNSLKNLLDLADKAGEKISAMNPIRGIDNAAIMNSCEKVIAKIPQVKILCNGAKVEEVQYNNSAHARYSRGEIPFYDKGSWKWKKKTSTLNHVAIGAVAGTQAILPTWLNLLSTKGMVNFEMNRALQMKQFNYMQEQQMKNWMNSNYFYSPQTFTNGYYNIYNLDGFSYNSGYQF